MREKIVEYLMEHFCTVYCSMCGHVNNFNDPICHYCYRDRVNWKLDKYAAEKIADDIIKIVHEDIK